MRKIGLHARVAALQQVQETPPEATEATYICIWNSWHLFICVVCTARAHRVLATFREHVTDCEAFTETFLPAGGRKPTLQMWHRQTTPSSCWDGPVCIGKKAQILGASAGSRHGSGRITQNFGLLSLQRLRIWTGRCKDRHVMSRAAILARAGPAPVDLGLRNTVFLSFRAVVVAWCGL
ncbi:unnamed protein product [Symbiodinium natans]|uniref:Uncharacterized protein n=1 Tax=Symbiodinium natans TaxID=878477 RepID=A0A812KZ85_9DINO|nr:unnamed protein product [Symbiodinium natans]